MGYTIRIGELKKELLEGDEEDFEPGEDRYWYTAKAEKHENAPADDVPTSKTNQRWPSYSAWDGFARETGLYDKFFDKGSGWFSKHPGYARLFPWDVERIDKALLDYKNSKNPIQYNIDRLMWLQYWVTWAVTNCKIPVTTNS